VLLKDHVSSYCLLTSRITKSSAYHQLQRRMTPRWGSRNKPKQVFVQNDVRGVGVQTATVCIPVKSVTVADPPRINIELTMMFVARLRLRLRICLSKSRREYEPTQRT
jgi:hypothetical protein